MRGCSPSLPTSTPASSCLSITCRTAVSARRASSAVLNASPCSWRISSSARVGLRGRLPTCVVRIRESLLRIGFSSGPSLELHDRPYPFGPLHVLEGRVDLIERHRARHQVIDPELALHVPVHQLGHAGAALGPAE